MGPLVVLLLLLTLSALWIFFRFQPYVEQSKLKVLSTVNYLFLGLGGVLALLAVARAYSIYEPSPTAPQLLPGFAASYALGCFCLCLVAGFVMRNFVIFRNTRGF